MKKSNSKSKPLNKPKVVEDNIDKELNDLIDKNESLKKGIEKIIKEIEKETNQKSN